MVNAILAGRKSQTRRVLTPQPPSVEAVVAKSGSGFSVFTDHHFKPDEFRVAGPVWAVRELMGREPIWKCPCGAPGDRLWVRETWTELLHTSPATDEPLLCPGDKLIEHATRTPEGRWHYDGKVIAYRATSSVEFCDGDGFSGEYADKDDMPRWRSPIHMPRWASRITLEVTGVRVERLQEITPVDAIAEGFMPDRDSGLGTPEGFRAAAEKVGGPFPRGFFAVAWDNLNAGRGYSWESNPWVWVVSFKRVDETIGTV